MPRARNIKPGFFRNEELVELPFSYRILFAGLWVIADRAGRLEDRPKRIKMEVFPADDVDIEDGLNALQSRGFLLRYSADGARYIQVLNFEKHQNPHKNEAPSSIPEPDLHSASTVQAPESHSATHADSLIPCSLIPDSLIPDSLQNTSSAAPTESGRKADALADGFAEFWNAYPKKVEKKAALEAWKSKRLNGRAQEVIDHVRQRAARDKSWVDGYIPSPKRFIRDERWRDEYAQTLSHRDKVLRALEERGPPILEGRLANG